MAENDAGALPLQKQIQGMISATQAAILLQTEEKFNSLVLETETLNQNFKGMVLKKDFEELKTVINSIQGGFEQFKEDAAKNQKVIDNFVASQNSRQGASEKKDFGSAWADTIATEVESKQAELKDFQTNPTARIKFDLKVGTMVIANVSGETVQSYNQRQGLVPEQLLNIRDIIPTTPSPTGSFITYRETGTSGAIGIQTEASAKSQIDYSFTREQVVSKYIAGQLRFSKQFMYSLPFINTQLPRMLLRDFYKKENDYLYSAMQLAATGDTGSVGTNTAEQILDLIANQRTANFQASVILTDWRTWSSILSTSKGTGYGNPGGVFFDSATGNARFAGIPITGASFADADSVLLWDNGYVERVETETLSVTFSYEDQDNFIKNLVTVKVECFEELNILRPDAIISTTTS